ncbi:MAG: NAD(P)-dependent oxidoreductase [Verrucomicrobia bacterium]|nr:NAD(P)-dependent oxidoreductase [Verrucomicrobiota bacterium]MDA1068987.1 NAD(P)-dependent oxidoreductase [Verrucomicrobiota bacterium]
MKVLVTGASGRLGSNVCRMLKETGIEFRAVDRVPADTVGYEVENPDLHDPVTCHEILTGIDVLAHFANHANWNSTDPERLYKENVTMNMNLFQAAADVGCHRIVFSSSVQVPDGQMPVKTRMEHPNFLPYIPMDSDMPAIPMNSYALSKLAAEDALEYFSRTKAMTCVVIRYPLLIDSQMLKAGMDQGGIPRGNCYDGFTYLPVYSAAEVAVKAMTAEVDGYRNYFVASKDNLEQQPAREIIEAELSHLPCKKPIEEMDSLVDCSKVEAELGWQQPQSMAESFEKYGSLNAVRPYE